MYFFISAFTYCVWEILFVFHTSIVCFFLLLNSFLLYEYMSVCLSCHLMIFSLSNYWLVPPNVSNLVYTSFVWILGGFFFVCFVLFRCIWTHGFVSGLFTGFSWSFFLFLFLVCFLLSECQRLYVYAETRGNVYLTL